MEISKDFIDKFLQIVNQQSNSMVRSKPGFGKFSINEVLMDYRNSETLFTLDYTELDRVERTKELGKYNCFKITFIGNNSEFKSEFYKRVVEWFIFSKTTDLINYGIKSINETIRNK